MTEQQLAEFWPKSKPALDQAGRLSKGTRAQIRGTWERKKRGATVSSPYLCGGDMLTVMAQHDHCAQAETRAAAIGWAVASRRSVRLHQRQTAVRLAGSG
jgi:hypothetical protein